MYLATKPAKMATVSAAQEGGCRARRLPAASVCGGRALPRAFRGPPRSARAESARRSRFRERSVHTAPGRDRAATSKCPRRPRLLAFRECAAYPDRQNSQRDRKSTRLNSSHVEISYAVFCLKKKNAKKQQ